VATAWRGHLPPTESQPSCCQGSRGTAGKQVLPHFKEEKEEEEGKERESGKKEAVG
jgi:hypothetical protein